MIYVVKYAKIISEDTRQVSSISHFPHGHRSFVTSTECELSPCAANNSDIPGNMQISSFRMQDDCVSIAIERLIIARATVKRRGSKLFHARRIARFIMTKNTFALADSNFRPFRGTRDIRTGSSPNVHGNLVSCYLIRALNNNQLVLMKDIPAMLQF